MPAPSSPGNSSGSATKSRNITVLAWRKAVGAFLIKLVLGASNRGLINRETRYPYFEYSKTAQFWIFLTQFRIS